MICRACGREHSPLVRCEVAARVGRGAVTPDVANNVANTLDTGGDTYRYRDVAKRRAYQRDLMRCRRAEEGGPPKI